MWLYDVYIYIERETEREREREQYTDYIESENIAKNGQENPEKSGNFII